MCTSCVSVIDVESGACFRQGYRRALYYERSCGSSSWRGRAGGESKTAGSLVISSSISSDTRQHLRAEFADLSGRTEPRRNIRSARQIPNSVWIHDENPAAAPRPRARWVGGTAAESLLSAPWSSAWVQSASISFLFQLLWPLTLSVKPNTLCHDFNQPAIAVWTTIPS